MKNQYKAQKIHGILPRTHGISSAMFPLQTSNGMVQSCEELFLLVNSSMELILGIPFSSLCNIDVEFAEARKLTWRSYDIRETLPISSQVELIDIREFAKPALD